MWAVEQAVTCIWLLYETKRALPSTSGLLELGSLHTWGALFQESMSHQPRVLAGYWVNQLFFSQMVGWRDIPTGSKNNRLHQPKAWEPCTMHCMYHKILCRITCLASKQLWQFEQRVLQTGSSEGGLQWQREVQQLRSTQYRYTVHETLNPRWQRCL